MPGIGTTHHVQIGDHFFLLRQATYRKRPSPLFGARFTTGDPNYNTLSSWQFWAQTCWVGGFGAETWKDDAMFDEGVGIDAMQHEVMTLARDLGPSTRGTWVLDNALSGPKIMRVYNNKLYCLVTNTTPGLLYRYNDGSPGTWTLIKTFTGEQVNWMEAFGGYLVFGDSGTTMNRMTNGEAFSTFAKPSGRTEVIYTLKVYRGHLYVGLGQFIYRLKTDFTWDGSTFFYEAADINYLNQSDVHLGFLYFASHNGHILRTDGNNTFDLWAFEPHVTIWGIRSFDGRLFILTGEEIEGTNSMQTVLYQFSGAAVTELKRWGKVGYDTTGGKLRAYERKLFFGASNLLGMGDDEGFGIAAYDPVEDAFHVFASNRDSTAFTPGTEGIHNVIDDVCYFKGRLFCVTRRHGAFVTPWTYRDASRGLALYDNTPLAADASLTHNGGWYDSSDFDAGTPGLLKLWSAIKVHADLPNAACSIGVEASIDGGISYFKVGEVQHDGVNTRYATELPLGGEESNVGADLNTNGDFESFSGLVNTDINDSATLAAGLPGWDLLFGQADSNVQVYTTAPYEGSNSLLLKHGAAPVHGTYLGVETDEMPVTAGQMYSFRGRMRGTPGNSPSAAGTILVRWYNSVGALISLQQYRQVAGQSSAWQEIVMHRVAPEGAATARLGVRNVSWAGSSIANDAVLFDNVQMYAAEGTPLRATRLKYRLTLRTTDTSYSPQLRGVIVRYLPIPEPNWVWEMTLVLSDRQELLDGTIEAPDNEAKIAALREAFRTQNLVYYRDVNGEEYTQGGSAGARIENMEELLPHLGPSSAGELEYEVRLSLMEMVDSYEDPSVDLD